MDTKCKGLEQLVLIGANARVGNAVGASQFVGPCAPAVESDNGFALRTLATEAKLFLVNTFFDAGVTWRSNRGTYARIDYILATERLFYEVSACRADHDFDLTFTPGRTTTSFGATQRCLSGLMPRMAGKLTPHGHLARRSRPSGAWLTLNARSASWPTSGPSRPPRVPQ